MVAQPPHLLEACMLGRTKSQADGLVLSFQADECGFHGTRVMHIRASSPHVPSLLQPATAQCSQHHLHSPPLSLLPATLLPCCCRHRATDPPRNHHDVDVCRTLQAPWAPRSTALSWQGCARCARATSCCCSRSVLCCAVLRRAAWCGANHPLRCRAVLCRARECTQLHRHPPILPHAHVHVHVLSALWRTAGRTHVGTHSGTLLARTGVRGRPSFLDHKMTISKIRDLRSSFGRWLWQAQAQVSRACCR